MIKINKYTVAAFCVVLVSAGYLSTNDVFEALFPNAHEDYYLYIDYTKIKNKAYEVMFFLAFVFFAILGKGIGKAVSVGMLFLLCGSVLDKCFYNRNYYHIFDDVLTNIGIIVGSIVYIKEKCKK